MLRKHIVFALLYPPTVTLSGAPLEFILRIELEREVEGPRQCVLCHAKSGNSTENVSFFDGSMKAAVLPRRADALAGLRIAPPPHKKRRHPAKPGCYET